MAVFNFIQPGDSIEFTAPGGGVVAGTPVQIGQILVIPMVSAAATFKFNAMIRGVFRVTKIGSQAWTEGALVYWDSGNARFTTIGPGNLLAGFATRVVASGASDTTGYVMLAGHAGDSGT